MSARAKKLRATIQELTEEADMLDKEDEEKKVLLFSLWGGPPAHGARLFSTENLERGGFLSLSVVCLPPENQAD